MLLSLTKHVYRHPVLGIHGPNVTYNRDVFQALGLSMLGEWGINLTVAVGAVHRQPGLADTSGFTGLQPCEAKLQYLFTADLAVEQAAQEVIIEPVF